MHEREELACLRFVTAEIHVRKYIQKTRLNWTLTCLLLPLRSFHSLISSYQFCFLYILFFNEHSNFFTQVYQFVIYWLASSLFIYWKNKSKISYYLYLNRFTLFSISLVCTHPWSIFSHISWRILLRRRPHRQPSSSGRRRVPRDQQQHHHQQQQQQQQQQQSRRRRRLLLYRYVTSIMIMYSTVKLWSVTVFIYIYSWTPL